MAVVFPSYSHKDETLQHLVPDIQDFTIHAITTDGDPTTKEIKTRVERNHLTFGIDGKRFS